MKRIVIFFVLAAILVSCNKKDSAKDLFEMYEGKEGVYAFRLPPALFLTMLGESLETGNSGYESIDLVKVLIFSEKEAKTLTNKEMLKDMSAQLAAMDFQELLQFSSGGANVSLSIKNKEDNPDMVTDVIGLVEEEDTFLALGLSGELQLKEIARLAMKLDYDQLKGLR